MTLTTHYWAVLYTPHNISDAIIHPNSTHLWYLSESYFDSLKMAFKRMPKNLGGCRPIFRKHTKIMRLSPQTVATLLRHDAEEWASLYDDCSNAFRSEYAAKLLVAYFKKLVTERKLDFRIPCSGIRIISTDIASY